jgi:hypothetical protein
MPKKIWLFVLALLIIVPLLVERGLSQRGERHNEMVSKYERYCLETPCEADFNGNGKKDLLIVDRKTPPSPGFDSWLVATEDGRELLRLPHWFKDGSFRTHIAIRNESGGDRLLVFDGTHMLPGSSSAPASLVFAWNGQQMVNAQPTDLDHDILTALATRDDSGTFHYWILYEFVRLPVLAVYYLLLAGITTWLAFRRTLDDRRVLKNLP